jgi:hypothetical protein
MPVTRKRPRADASSAEMQTASSSIGVQLPRHLHFRPTYTARDPLTRPPLRATFSQRHRDTPAHFTGAHNSLFNAKQRNQIEALFAPGWQTDAASPLHALVGSCRLSSSNRTQKHDVYEEEASVGTFVSRAAAGEKLVVSDVKLGELPAAVTSGLAAGPALFQQHNLLQAVLPDKSEQYHSLCYAIFATRT